MVMIVCPNCKRVVSVAGDSSDFVHQCDSGVDALDTEDVLVIGDWEDYTGTGKVTAPMMQGAENEIFGTFAQAMGEAPIHEVTEHGRAKSTHRTRKHLQFIEIKR